MLRTSIFNNIEQFCRQENLVSPDQTIIIGLSGGPDSVFLLYFFLHLQKKYTLQLIATHLDHGWRAESTRDAQFCADLCKKLGVTYVQEKLKPTPKSSGSAEHDARQARRTFFERTLRQAQGEREGSIALAHHQDDLIETFFIRLVRGASVTGLASIKPRHGLYIRPLLGVSKAEIVAYLQENNIPYCTDVTNQDTTFLRNNIRHNLLPVYEKLEPRARTTLLHTIAQLQKTDTYLEQQANKFYAQLVIDGWLSLPEFLALDPIIQHRILLNWLIQAQAHFTPTEHFFDEIIRFLRQKESKTHMITQAWGIQKIKNRAAITKRAILTSDFASGLLLSD